MFRITFYDADRPDLVVEADKWQHIGDFLDFSLDGAFVAAVQARDALIVRSEKKGGE